MYNHQNMKILSNSKLRHYFINVNLYALILTMPNISFYINPLTANPEISRRVIKTPRLPTMRYLVAFFMSQNCQRRDISLTLRQNGTRQHRSIKATGDCKCLTIHVTHSFLISIKINTLFFDIIIYFTVVLIMNK